MNHSVHTNSDDLK